MSEALMKEVEELRKDRDRLDFLQHLNDKATYTGRCILRWSTMNRGWRLHECSDAVHTSVREAIDFFMGADEHKEGR